MNVITRLDVSTNNINSKKFDFGISSSKQKVNRKEYNGERRQGQEKGESRRGQGEGEINRVQRGTTGYRIRVQSHEAWRGKGEKEGRDDTVTRFSPVQKGIAFGVLTHKARRRKEEKEGREKAGTWIQLGAAGYRVRIAASQGKRR